MLALREALCLLFLQVLGTDAARVQPPEVLSQDRFNGTQEEGFWLNVTEFGDGALLSFIFEHKATPEENQVFIYLFSPAEDDEEMLDDDRATGLMYVEIDEGKLEIGSWSGDKKSRMSYQPIKEGAPNDTACIRVDAFKTKSTELLLFVHGLYAGRHEFVESLDEVRLVRIFGAALNHSSTKLPMAKQYEPTKKAYNPTPIDRKFNFTVLPMFFSTRIFEATLFSHLKGPSDRNVTTFGLQERNGSWIFALSQAYLNGEQRVWLQLSVHEPITYESLTELEPCEALTGSADLLHVNFDYAYKQLRVSWLKADNKADKACTAVLDKDQDVLFKARPTVATEGAIDLLRLCLLKERDRKDKSTPDLSCLKLD